MIEFEKEINNSLIKGRKVYQSKHYTINVKPDFQDRRFYIVSLQEHDFYPRIYCQGMLSSVGRGEYMPEIYVDTEYGDPEKYPDVIKFVRNELKPFLENFRDHQI
ncbi:MAG: hypothetical protein IKQ27_06845 [Lachnospiraceae bacterium]|nr:hypothetical protein [Lachnospiraceae bacterium]MBR3734879.1 hypothetical protein [Lachnospiraceae bacterium]MBR6156659.1 hypothetical protein [Lachnospiraceae bacterium]